MNTVRQLVADRTGPVKLKVGINAFPAFFACELLQKAVAEGLAGCLNGTI